jgi:hypothetical protein
MSEFTVGVAIFLAHEGAKRLAFKMLKSVHFRDLLCIPKRLWTILILQLLVPQYVKQICRSFKHH